MGRVTRSVMLSVLGVAVLAVLALVAFRVDPVPVDVAPVERGRLRVTIDADGKTRVREVFALSSPIAGTARRAPVQVGDPVVAGQTVVAVVDPATPTLLDSRTRRQAEAAVAEAEAAVALARTRVEQARAELAHANATHDRLTALAGSGVATPTALEDAETALSLAKAALAAETAGEKMAESSLNRARAALIEPGAPTAQEAPPQGEQCCVTLRAPIDGVVLSLPEISEHAVIPGSVLATLGRVEDLEIVADLLSADAVGLAPGARAVVERWGGPDPLEARLRRIEPRARTKLSALGIEEQRVDAIFDIVTPPTDRRGLGDGYAVFLRVIRWERADVLQVPLGALFRQGDTWAVFVDDDGIARLRQVQIGQRGATAAEIVSGLAEGELVVTHPADTIADNVKISPRRTD